MSGVRGHGAFAPGGGVRAVEASGEGVEEGEGFAGRGGRELALEDFEGEGGAGFPEDAVFVFGEGASDACSEECGRRGAERKPSIVMEIVRRATGCGDRF